MAYNRSRRTSTRRRAPQRARSYSRGRAAPRRSSGGRRSSGSTVRIVIENPGVSPVARPFQTPAPAPKQAKF